MHRAFAHALDAAGRFAHRSQVADARGIGAGYLLAGKYDEAQRWLNDARELDAKGKL